MRTKKEAYIHRISRRLKDWSETIDELEARGSRTAAGTDAVFDERLRNLREKRDLLSDKLRELKESGSDAWTAQLTGVESARKELKDAFAAARDEFKKAA